MTTYGSTNFFIRFFAMLKTSSSGVGDLSVAKNLINSLNISDLSCRPEGDIC